MRSCDSASAGDWGRVLAMFEARLEVGPVVLMLMKTEEVGAGLIALRVVALGDSSTLGRLRFRIGEGCCVVV